MCNLTCSWCDTKYTWDWKNYDYNEEVTEQSIPFVKNQIIHFKPKHLVITGGEPLMQQNEIIDLLHDLKGLDYYVEVETNCTIKPKENLLKLVDQWNVSPKTSNSGNKLSLYEIKECYKFFASLANSFFKFVVEKEDDLKEIEYFIKKYEIRKNHILLMPQASNKKELFLRKKAVKGFAKKYGLGFSPRLHIEKWGNQRKK